MEVKGLSYMLLTTLKADGRAPVNSAVRVAADGDRAWFRTRSGSAAAKRLGRAGRVQVAPCTVLGLCSFGPPFSATARLLAGEHARRAERKLAGNRRLRHRVAIPLPGWMRRWRPVFYELVADDHRNLCRSAGDVGAGEAGPGDGAEDGQVDGEGQQPVQQRRGVYR